MKPKFIEAYMDVAHRFAELSSAQRLKVGAIIVKDDKIISMGYNGTPSGWDNDCEYREYMPVMEGDSHQWPFDPDTEYPYENENGARYKLVTKPEVIHAESNAITKLAKSSESGEGAFMFLTHAPCINCAKLVYQSGIAFLYYKEMYKGSDGLDFLKQAGVICKHVD